MTSVAFAWAYLKETNIRSTKSNNKLGIIITYVPRISSEIQRMLKQNDNVWNKIILKHRRGGLAVQTGPGKVGRPAPSTVA